MKKNIEKEARRGEKTVLFAVFAAVLFASVLNIGMAYAETQARTTSYQFTDNDELLEPAATNTYNFNVGITNLSSIVSCSINWFGNGNYTSNLTVTLNGTVVEYTKAGAWDNGVPCTDELNTTVASGYAQVKFTNNDVTNYTYGQGRLFVTFLETRAVTNLSALATATDVYSSAQELNRTIQAAMSQNTSVILQNNSEGVQLLNNSLWPLTNRSAYYSEQVDTYVRSTTFWESLRTHFNSNPILVRIRSSLTNIFA